MEMKIIVCALFGWMGKCSSTLEDVIWNNVSFIVVGIVVGLHVDYYRCKVE